MKDLKCEITQLGDSVGETGTPYLDQRIPIIQGLWANNSLASRWESERLAFSVRETAQLLGVSEKSVRRLLARGLLHSSNALRHRLIPRFEIERFLKQTM